MPVKYVDQTKRTGAGTEDNPLTDVQIDDLGKRGIYEGDYVPGKGILSPTGTFRSKGVSEIQSTPIITSQDSQNQFNQDKDALDKIINAPAIEDPADSTKPKETADKTDASGVGDETYNTYRQSTDKARADAEAQAQEVLDEYDNLYELELAAIDARTNATVKEIKRSFSKRIEEQKRINKINVDRVKAYGLSSGAAMYTPIAWTDAITERERKNAEEIQGLERERIELIDAARAAADESDAALLSQKIKDYNSVKDKLNTRLAEIERESAAQYEELVRLREEQEADFKQKQQESLMRLQAYYRLNSEEVENLTPEEKEALVNRIADKYGFQTYEVLGVLDEVTATDFEALKTEAEIERINAQTKASEASAASAYALAAKRRRETEKLDEDEDESSDDTPLNADQKKRIEQAGLENAPRQQQLDFLYMDEFDYEDKYPDGAESGGDVGDVQSRADAAGYDYAGMKAAGYSDEEIQAALEEAGV